MTNSAGLVRTVASALMINEASLAVQMRILREADIIPTGGRGTGGYAMRPRDAAALTIAAVVSGSLKDTADLTEKFLRLPMTYRNVFGPNRPQQVKDLRAGLDHDAVIRKFGMGRIPDGSDVQTTFASLIEMYIEYRLFPSLVPGDFSSPPEPGEDLTYRPTLAMGFFLPVPCVGITYVAGRIFREVMTFGGPNEPLDPFHYPAVLERAGMGHALQQMRVLPEPSLRQIADAVGHEGLRSALSPAPSRRKSKKPAKLDKSEIQGKKKRVFKAT